jgi:hypothetical protein
MQTYEHGNDSICGRHPSLFKERFYIFTPINDLVFSMPFEAINSLKVGEWSRLVCVFLTSGYDWVTVSA